jgi:hypothetical protein
MPLGIPPCIACPEWGCDPFTISAGTTPRYTVRPSAVFDWSIAAAVDMLPDDATDMHSPTTATPRSSFRRWIRVTAVLLKPNGLQSSCKEGQR